MKLVQEINILHSKKLAIVLNILGILLIFAFGYLFTWLGTVVLQLEFTTEQYTMESMLYFLGVSIVLIIIHELIHGLFFKIYKPENKIKFGVKLSQGMAYATSPGSLYNRRQMLVISLAPFVLISLSLTVLAVLGVFSAVSYVLLAALHAAGCIGDFYYTYLLAIKHRNINLLAEDTETGLLIYQV